MNPVAICPECGESVRTLENSFFGVGLAVHRYVRVCPDCNWTEFILGTEREAAPPSEEPPNGWAALFQSLMTRTAHVSRRHR